MCHSVHTEAQRATVWNQSSHPFLFLRQGFSAQPWLSWTAFPFIFTWVLGLKFSLQAFTASVFNWQNHLNGPVFCYR